MVAEVVALLMFIGPDIKGASYPAKGYGPMPSP